MSVETGVATINQEFTDYVHSLRYYAAVNSLPRSLFSNPDYLAVSVGGTDRFLSFVENLRAANPEMPVHGRENHGGSFVNVIRLVRPWLLKSGRIHWVEVTEEDELSTWVGHVQCLVPDLGEAKATLFKRVVDFTDERHAVIAPIDRRGHEVWFSEESISAEL